jgi:hypothetical protein
MSEDQKRDEKIPDEKFGKWIEGPPTPTEPWRIVEPGIEVEVRGERYLIGDCNDVLGIGAFGAEFTRDDIERWRRVDREVAYRAGWEDATRAGYAEAVARLRDDGRYRNWWSADGAWQHQPTGRYWDAPARKYLADYLETVGPDGPDVRTKSVDQPGVQPTEEQRAEDEDQKRSEEQDRE